MKLLRSLPTHSIRTFLFGFGNRYISCDFSSALPTRSGIIVPPTTLTWCLYRDHRGTRIEIPQGPSRKTGIHVTDHWGFRRDDALQYLRHDQEVGERSEFVGRNKSCIHWTDILRMNGIFRN
jgi:hypothetical protein